MSVFEELIDNKLLKILKLLLNNKEQQFHLQKISQDTKVPVSSVFRIMKKLVKLELVEQIVIGKVKIYKIAHNEKTKQLDVNIKNG